MAFPSSYTGWLAYVRNWIGADEYSDAQIGQFLDLAQVRLNTDLMSFHMEKLHRHVITPDEVADKVVDLAVVIPDFSKVRLVSLPGQWALDVAAVNEFVDKSAEITDGYARGVYTIDAGQLYLWPWPAENAIVDIHYYEMVPTLSTSRNSNTFTLRHPDLLLYAASLEAAPYMVEDERIPVWESKYISGLLTANAASAKIKMGSTPLRRDFKTYNWGVSRLGGLTGSAAGGVTPTPPSNTLAPVLSQTTADTSDLLSCTTGTWAASPTSHEYQWMRDGVDIVGETASTYSTTSLDDGTTITCKVRALNADGASDYITSSNSCLVSAEVLPVPFSSYFPDRYFGMRYFGQRYFG